MSSRNRLKISKFEKSLIGRTSMLVPKNSSTYDTCQSELERLILVRAVP